MVYNMERLNRRCSVNSRRSVIVVFRLKIMKKRRYVPGMNEYMEQAEHVVVPFAVRDVSENEVTNTCTIPVFLPLLKWVFVELGPLLLELIPI